MGVYVTVKGYEGKPLCNSCIQIINDAKNKDLGPPTLTNSLPQKNPTTVQQIYCQGRTISKCWKCSGLGKQWVHPGMPTQRQFTCPQCQYGWIENKCPHNSMTPHYY
jgi:hypothetical protein